MVLIFTVFSFFVALAYGAFNASMRDFEDWGNYYFSNTSIDRVVVRKTDKTTFDADDFAEILDIANVKLIVENDFILDYTLSYTMSTVNEWGYYDSFYTYALPLEVLEEVDLYAGRMPAAADEIVIATSSLGLDSYVENYLGKTMMETTGRGWGATSDVFVTIVGIVSTASIDLPTTGYYDYVLLGEDAFDDLTKYVYLAGGFASTSFTGIDNLGDPFVLTNPFSQYPLVLDEDVPLNTIQVPSYGGACNPATDICEADGALTVTDFYREQVIAGFHYEVYASNDDWSIRLNPATATAILGDDVYQISVWAASDVGVDQLVRRIGTIGGGLFDSKYAAFYPRDPQSAEEFARFFVILNIISAGITLFVTLAGATLITYVIFRAIINTKMHDYAIYRTIGASQKMIKMFIYLENVFTAVIAYTIVAGTLIALNLKENFLDDDHQILQCRQPI
ncbi:MAG: hypothetical protein MZU97_13870 [Bacillus subtilis]|nr:hypothetical protein [Bacillus subtilis]